MAVGDGTAYLKKDSLCSLHIHPARRDFGEQTPPFNQLHEHIDVLVRPDRPIQMNDVDVAKPPHDVNLALKLHFNHLLRGDMVKSLQHHFEIHNFRSGL
jgi:hypothetical protein